ncbi:MAG: RsmB/NOP family class I SAM-dependent RNA methyltransferase [Opitutaceae bacterium]|nr:RsmB/NOP family class I SAM-dependent RNA methyltransferase [Verrucomicrobiales bacterium]
MNSRLLEVAIDVIGRAGRDCPADSALRTVLKGRGLLSRSDSREISRAVFAYYRWIGWLDLDESVDIGLNRALDLDQAFLERLNVVSPAELRSKAVPGWTKDVMEISDAWMRTLQVRARRWLRAKKGQGRSLAEKLGDCWIPPGARFADAVEYRGVDDLFRTPEFQAGEFELQDIASQAVGLLCDPKPGETWWDVCAGEGGKLLHLSDLMGNKGLIWASDRAEWRLKKLKMRAARAGCFNYRSVAWNGGAKLPTKTKFDGVLLDAPCSGVGTWQRNPHARWTTTAQDVAELSDVQAKLLARVAVAVKPGGKLIYSVCTMTQAETAEVAHAFTSAFPEFEPLALRGFGQADDQTQMASAATQMIWPQDLGGNGMFIAAWQRNAAG